MTVGIARFVREEVSSQFVMAMRHCISKMLNTMAKKELQKFCSVRTFGISGQLHSSTLSSSFIVWSVTRSWTLGRRRKRLGATAENGVVRGGGEIAAAAAGVLGGGRVFLLWRLAEDIMEEMVSAFIIS